MSGVLLPRRQLIARAGGLVAAAGALPLLSGCDAISEAPAVRKILSMGEEMNRASQRALMDRDALAREFTRADLSPTFRSNGTRLPPGAAYAAHAPELALQAIAKLGDAFDPKRITHIVVASCTGFVAPGIDQILARRLGLPPTVERVLIGFMGCYAGVTALRTARHIVRSDADAVVLVVSVELSTLHLSLADQPEPLLAMLQFSDGAAAGIVSAAPRGFALGEGRSLALDASEDLIRWDIGDRGFEMTLSGEVPGRLREALSAPAVRETLFGGDTPPPLLAVHAGGRSVLDAVEHALDVPADALGDSRSVLARFGNMSSATILFVLVDMMARGATGRGLAIAFGPGLAAEAIRFDSGGIGA